MGEWLTFPYVYPQVTPLRVNEVGTVLVPFQLPRKPTELRVAPGAMVASYERLVTVTWLPDCEALAFQICVMVCPLANEKTSDQLLMALELVLVMESEPWKPPGH